MTWFGFAGCDGIAHSGRVVDACGECDGSSTSCAGCDAIPNSGKFWDVCGVCGGNGLACRGCDAVVEYSTKARARTLMLACHLLAL